MCMFKFPKNLYTDVRIEDVYQTSILYTMDNLDELKMRRYKAAFIRIFDGKRWYYSATSDVNNIQKEIDALEKLAAPDENIDENPIVTKFEVNKGSFSKFTEESVSNIDKETKLNLLKPYFDIVKRSSIKLYKLLYMDEKKTKEFYSSKGASLTFDTQIVGLRVSLSMVQGDKKLNESFSVSGSFFTDLLKKEQECRDYITKCEEYLANSVMLKPGKYTVVLSPLAAGVFAHESFGHKSESDFMIGDETMKREWAIGTKVGSDILSIIDDGNEQGNGFIPYDDEGTRARKTYLVDKGKLAGRLHSTSTAASLEEGLTGNGRALNFEFEPIVRMTCTYILPGDKSKDQLFSEVEEGIFIDTIKHGSGMSTFTIAPNRCYFIRNGKIAEPVNVSVITGSVFETLGEIDGVSDKLELLSFVGGGCGKMEQMDLPVGFGGPYVRIRNMNVQ